MKVAVAWLVILALPTHAGAQSADRWFGADKVKHFVTSAVVQSMAFSLGRAAGWSRSSAETAAAATTAVVGVGKETVDHRHGKPFSVRDLAWDAGGGLSAWTLLRHTR